jgi:hypothetical protein
MTMPPITKRFLLRSFWPKKIDYWKDLPIPFPSFDSGWLQAVSRNKVCLKGTKISG